MIKVNSLDRKPLISELKVDLVILSTQDARKTEVEIMESSDGNGFLIRTREGTLGIEPLRPDFIKISIK